MQQLNDPSQKLKKPDIYVLSRILERLWRAGGEMKATRLQNAVGLNYISYIQYLEWMDKKGLIVIRNERNNRKFVTLTAIGLEVYHRIVEWINLVVLSET